MSKQTQQLTSHELLHKVIEFGLNTILESKSLNVDTAVKNDLLAELNTVLINDISLDSANNILNSIEGLAEKFKTTSRDKRIIIGYLFEKLDLPRIGTKVEGMDDLQKALERANVANGLNTITPQGEFNFDNLPNNAIIYTGEGKGLTLIPYIRVSEQNVIVFVLTRHDYNLVIYHLLVADNNFVVSKLKNYTIDNLLSDLNKIENSDYEPKLITERETINIDDVTTDDIDAMLQSNVVAYQNDEGSNLLLEHVVARKAEAAGIDLSNKRVHLANTHELSKYALEAIAATMKPDAE